MSAWPPPAAWGSFCSSPSAASGGRFPPCQFEQRERPQSLGVFLVVEVPGIEPGSNGTNRSILRAQSLCGAFSLAGLCDPSANTAYITVESLTPP